MATATFRIIKGTAFKAQYGEAFEALEDFEEEKPVTFGEVTIPGHGKRACLVGVDRVPTWFYDEDDGWQRVPSGASFLEVSNTGQLVAPKAARLNPRGPMVVYHL